LYHSTCNRLKLQSGAIASSTEGTGYESANTRNVIILSCLVDEKVGVEGHGQTCMKNVQELSRRASADGACKSGGFMAKHLNRTRSIRPKLNQAQVIVKFACPCAHVKDKRRRKLEALEKKSLAHFSD